MAIATVARDVFTCNSEKTQLIFLDYIASRFTTNLGFVLENSSNAIGMGANGNSYTGKRRLVSLNYSPNSTNTKDKVFFDIQAFQHFLKFAISDSLTEANIALGQVANSPYDGYGLYNFNLTTGDPIIFHSFNHPEIKAVTLTQGYTGLHLSLAIIKPSGKPSWWNEADSLYSFMSIHPVGGAGLTMYTAYYNLLASKNACSVNFGYNSQSSFVTSNPITGLRSMIGGFNIVANESEGNRGGVVGTVSSDLAYVNATGLNINSIIQVQGSTARYQTLAKSDNNPVLAVKVVD